jgi:hypothetical protein
VTEPPSACGEEPVLCCSSVADHGAPRGAVCFANHPPLLTCAPPPAVCGCSQAGSARGNGSADEDAAGAALEEASGRTGLLASVGVAGGLAVLVVGGVIMKDQIK